MERAHKELVAAAKSLGALEAEAPESLHQTESPAYEAFVEGLSEDFPPLSRGVLEAYEGQSVVSPMCVRVCLCVCVCLCV